MYVNSPYTGAFGSINTSINFSDRASYYSLPSHVSNPFIFGGDFDFLSVRFNTFHFHLSKVGKMIFPKFD